MEFSVEEDSPQLNFQVVDHEAEDEQANIMWAGRPTTMAKVRRVAEVHKVSPQTILELGTTAGHAESRLASTAAGDLVLRAGEGIKEIGETIGASLSRAAGHPEMAARVHAERKQREEFLSFIEKGGDLQSVLGDRGSHVMTSTTQSISSMAGASTLAGPVGLYSHIIGQSWESGLDDAQQHGLDGIDAVGHAGRRAIIDGGMMYLMGRAGQAIGVETTQVALSPAAKNAVSKVLSQAGPKAAMLRVAKETGGWAATGVQQALIAGGHQINDMASGLRPGLDWNEMFDAGMSGVIGRGFVGASQALNGHLKKIETKLPEIANGTRAAEIDIERGLNPLEVKDYVSNSKEFDRQTGRENTSKQFRDSYRDALDFYVDEARKSGDTGGLAKLEQDALRLREEDRQRTARVSQGKAKAANKGKTGESTIKTEPLAEPEIKTANERATFSLADFEAKVLPPTIGSVVAPSESKANPYILAPWETETRQQRRIRLLSQQVATHKEAIKSLRTDFSEKRALREDQLTSARELVQENIPSVEQYKFLQGIQAAKNPSSIEKLLTRVSDHIDAREHRLAVMDLKQAFAKAANLRTEFANTVKDVKGSIDMAAIKNVDAAKAIQQWAKENPQAILTDKDRATISRLEDKQNVNDMDASDIRDLSEYVQRLAYESKVKDRIIGNMQSSSIRDVGDTIASETAAAPRHEMQSQSLVKQIHAGLRGEDVKAQLGHERTVGSLMVHELAERPEATLRKLSPTLTNHIYEKLAIEDQHNFDMAAKNVTESLAGVFDSLGLGHADTVATSAKSFVGSQDATPLEAWRNQKRLIGGVELTRGEALMVSRWMSDPHAAKSVMQAGVELENGSRKLPPATPKILAELADFVGDKGNAIAQHMFDHDNGPLIDSVNATNEKLTGRALTDKRNVVPIVRTDEEFSQFLTSGRTAAGYQEALLDSYSSFKHRTGGVSALKIPHGMDAIDMFMAHADRMNRFAAFGVNARNAEMILNDPSVKGAILEKNGKQGYDHIVNAVKSHVIGSKPRTEGERKIAAANAAVVGSQIAGRIGIMLQQGMDPITAAPWDEGGIGHLAAGYGELSKRGLQAVENEMEQVLGQNSGNYWRRYKSEDYVGETTSGQFKRRSWFRPSALVQQFMRPTSRAEYFASAMPNYLAAKAAARAKFGLAEDDFSSHADNPEWVKTIVTAWDKKTYRGSNSSHGLELSGVLRYSKDNPIAATLTNFYNTSGKIYSLYTMGAESIRQGRYKEAASFLGGAAANAVVVATLGAAMTQGDKEKKKASLARRIFNRMVTGVVSLNPFGGQQLANQVIGPVMGMPQFGDNPSLLSETALQTAKGLTGFTMQFMNLSDKSLDPAKFNAKLARNIEDFLVGMGSLAGMPAPGAMDIARRIKKGTLAPGLQPAGITP
jgi:hypothetical protein